MLAYHGKLAYGFALRRCIVAHFCMLPPGSLGINPQLKCVSNYRLPVMRLHPAV